MLRVCFSSGLVNTCAHRTLLCSAIHVRTHGLSDDASLSPTRSIYRSTPPRRRLPRIPRQTISTLHPDHLKNSDFIDLSRYTRRWIYSRANSSTLVGSMIHYYGARQRFPEGCCGFLYYHRDPELPPTSGAIRFRLTPNASAASFKRGTDLMQPHRSVPWSLSLFTLADSKIGAGLLSLAQKDGLITPDLIAHCRELTKGKRGRGGILSHYLFALEQPFFLDLSVQPLLSIVGPDHIRAAQFALARDWVYDSSSQTHKFFQAYSGHCMARFERSLASEDEGRRVVVRILDILKPIEPTVKGYKGPLERPTSGSLLTRGGRPVVIDVDQNTRIGMALRLLMP